MKRAILSSKTRFKKPKVNIHFGKIVLVLFLVLGQIFAGNFNKVEASTMQLKDVPLGSIVYDESWSWEHKTGNNYTGNGEIKPVQWRVVSKNHEGYPSNSVTLMSSELVGMHIYDNRYNYSTYTNAGYHDWKGSSIEMFLNTTFYDNFSHEFKKSVIDTNLKYGDAYILDGQPAYRYYTTINKVFLPSVNEMGGYHPNTGNLGPTFQYSVEREFKLGNNLQAFMTRSPHTAFGGIRIVMWHHLDKVWLDWGNNTQFGIIPVVNLKEDSKVISVGAGKYKITYNQSPSLITISPVENSYFSKVNQAQWL